MMDAAPVDASPVDAAPVDAASSTPDAEDAGPVEGIEGICTELCDAFCACAIELGYSCDAPGCYDECGCDLLGCTAKELSDTLACGSFTCDADAFAEIEACLGAVPCVDG